VSYVIFLLGILLKLGLFPGHFWVIQVVSGLKKISVIYVLGILKIAPILLLYQGLIFLRGYSQIIVFLGLIRVLVGSVLGITQTTLRGVLGSSSISHGGWMVVSLRVFIVEFYLISYLITFIIFILTWLIINRIERIRIPIISFSGLPPFLLFLPKLIVIFQLIITRNFFSIFLLIIGSLLRLYFYLKIRYSFFLIKHTASRLKSMSFSGLISLIPVFFYILFI
jgi:NADH-quinone oxidoreductase subunit N